MKNTMYMNNYDYSFKREIINKIEDKKKSFEYSSKVYLTDLEDEDNEKMIMYYFIYWRKISM